MCGKDTRGKPYDCGDCTCSSSSSYRGSHDPTATRIDGIYYIVCRFCGRDM